MSEDMYWEFLADPLSLQGRTMYELQRDLMDTAILFQEDVPVTIKTLGFCDCSECYHERNRQ